MNNSMVSIVTSGIDSHINILESIKQDVVSGNLKDVDNKVVRSEFQSMQWSNSINSMKIVLDAEARAEKAEARALELEAKVEELEKKLQETEVEEDL